MGMRGKPIELIVLTGSGNRSKAEIARRQATEIRLGGQRYPMPARVKDNPEAAKKWRWLARLYKGFTFVTEADVDLLERYCVCHAEFLDLSDRRREKALFFGGDFSVEKMLGADEIIKLDAAVNAKAGILNQISDRLFLNPRSRVANVPKGEPKAKPTDPLQAGGFGNV
jgi:phage terminase small subunit